MSFFGSLEVLDFSKKKKKSYFRAEFLIQCQPWLSLFSNIWLHIQTSSNRFNQNPFDVFMKGKIVQSDWICLSFCSITLSVCGMLFLIPVGRNLTNKHKLKTCAHVSQTHSRRLNGWRLVFTARASMCVLEWTLETGWICSGLMCVVWFRHTSLISSSSQLRAAQQMFNTIWTSLLQRIRMCSTETCWSTVTRCFDC